MTVEAPVELHSSRPPLSYREAKESPCMSCSASPCCTHLLLCTIALKTFMDVDRAIHLANFDGIVLAMGKSATSFQVYLHQPCRYLDVPKGLCTVHSTSLQPSVCVHYSAHWCAYKKVFGSDLDPDSPLLDARRMAWFAEHVVFDDDRDVVSVPSREATLDAFRSMPTEQKPLAVLEPDPVVQEWRSIVLSGRGSTAGQVRPHHYQDPEISSPCEGCQAWCCQYLVFDRDIPSNYEEVEFLRFSLGFPNVELAITEGKWSLLVRTTCRHLDGNRCSVYGTDQRPLKCSYFSALNCAYRTDLGVPHPNDLVRVRREHFEAFAQSVAFDELGRVVAIPSLELLRTRIEGAEKARAGVAPDRNGTE
jgi:hypothetical protein